MKCKEDKNHQWPQIVAILAACSCCIGAGMSAAWTSPSIPKLIANNSYVPMTFEATSWFTVLHPLSGFFLAPIFAILTEKIGRRPAILFVSVPQLITWLMTAFAKSPLVFYLTRVTSGLGDASLFISLPMYLSEITEPRIRGRWSCTLMVFLYLGQVIMNAVGFYLDIPTTAFICAGWSVISFLIFLPMPESPYFLLMKGRDEEAIKSLKWLRWRCDVEKEIRQIREDVERQLSERGRFKDIFAIESNRRGLFICLETRLCQQLSGIIAFIYYGQTIFKEAGGDIPDHIATIIFVVLMTLVSCLGASVIDKFGRRPLIIGSLLECATSLLLLTVFFYIKEYTNLDVSPVNWIPMLGLLLFVAGAGFGLNIVPTVLLGEVFPVSIKGKALCIMTSAFSLYVMVVSKLFQVLMEHFGLFGPFLLFCISCYLSAIFNYYYLIETKDKTLEEIQQNLKGNHK